MTTDPWTATDLPDLTGRTVVVTGGSSGLGVATARELARVGARVVLAVRDVAKGQAVANTLPGVVEVRELDLADLASVRSFAGHWRGDLDILINNAGIMQVPQGRTADGFELQVGTNHLGHFALTNLLLPHLTDRVVVLTSNLHTRGRIHLDDLSGEHRPYRATAAYCDSKLANLLFALELNRRFVAAGDGRRAVSAHPGVTNTNLVGHVRGVQGLIGNLVTRLMNQPLERAVLPTLYAAVQDVPGGSLIGPDGFAHLRGHPQIGTPSKAAQDADLAARLWALSARLTSTDADFPARG